MKAIVSALAALLWSSAALADWPKEYRDVVTGGCVLKLTGGADLPSKHRKAFGKLCECMTDGFERIMPAERVREVMALPQGEQGKAWENEPMRKVIDQCEARHKISELPELPVTAKDREEAMVTCALHLAKRAEDFEDGQSRVRNACTCVVDFVAKKPAPSEAEVDVAGAACVDLHLPPKK